MTKPVTKQVLKQVLEQNVEQLHRRKSNPVPSRNNVTKDIGAPSLSVIARSSHTNVDRLARRIAAHQVERLDELSLLGGYPSLDPATREVYETALRLAARSILESTLEGSTA
jgi:hypothetical protein